MCLIKKLYYCYDKYRVDHKNRGSFDKVVKGLKIGQKFLKSQPGILSVIDPSSDPIKYYNLMKDLRVKNFDLLWPHANIDLNPEGKPWENNSTKKSIVYSDWLIKIFNIWYKEKKQTNMNITMFNSIIGLILNFKYSGNEDFGLDEVGNLVIETNGDIQVVGALKLCGDGFTVSGASIKEHSFSEALETKLANLYYNSHKYLCKKCMECPILEVCGGGPIYSRYSSVNGFNNESIYCKDFVKLIVHIQNTIYSSLPEIYKDKFESIDYEEVVGFLDNFDNDSNQEVITENFKKLTSFSS